MRTTIVTLIAILATHSSYASDFDPDDHAAICAQMANAHHWSASSNAVSNCPCSMTELQKAMTPELFETTMNWQLDPSSLADILPESMSVSEFYDAVGPAFGATEATCGPMR